MGMQMTGPRLLHGFCSCRVFLLVVVLTFTSNLSLASAGSGKVVTSLPGYDGRLPFYLETGYVNVDEDNGAELFYYFVKSESGSGEDVPFLVWLNGGERCSVFSGLAFEIGFSFSRQPKGYEVGDISSSQQVHHFLIQWFSGHPEYLANPLYIGGESYAGKIVPFLAQMISEGTCARSPSGIEAGRRPLLNLKGYLVGNPAIRENINDTDVTYKVPFAHGFGIISDQLYEMILGHCQIEDYINPSNASNALCAQALGTFDNLISEVEQSHVLADKCVYASPIPTDGKSKMDGADGRKILMEQKLNHPPARPPFGCISYGYFLSYYWANDRRTRNALAIKEGTVDEWVRCHDDDDLPYKYDLRNVIKYHMNLTSKGYRALVYSGDHDLMVPHLGTQAWIRSLNFSVIDDWRAWHLGGQSAGLVSFRQPLLPPLLHFVAY
ncbi:hypothetical protein EJB05_12923 [Eragrostis curvula]|uniref:Carboxypeptidase n=1 Tax=Eragrostis curvula TaxID=38414 RepID=A0A5J9VWP1_9POAL|nr:hypothetical protein EJB05_12923 [Eragrostis curvula]